MSAKRGNWFRSRLAGSVWQDAAHEILLDLDAEGMSHLLSDSHAAETRIALLHSTMIATSSGEGCPSRKPVVLDIVDFVLP